MRRLHSPEIEPITAIGLEKYFLADYPLSQNNPSVLRPINPMEVT
jgi:hypothetical protein